MGGLSARSLGFQFSGSQRQVVSDVDIVMEAGERVAFVGPSGSGKSTLLHLLSGILAATEGKVVFDGVDISSLDADRRAEVRLRDFGFVFQFAELLPELTLAENVELPLRMLGRSRDSEKLARESMEQLGIAHIADRLPSQASGGERQRAAISRAMVHRPRVVFADEPTGALDQDHGELVMSRLLNLCHDSGATLLVVTHDPGVAAHLDRMVLLRDGRLQEIVNR